MQYNTSWQPSTKQIGFTLIELMIVITIIGVLTTLALPMYQNNLIRTRVTEGLLLASAGKIMVNESSNTQADLTATATVWNAQENNQGASSKFVTSTLINPTTGEITITFNTQTVGIATGADTLILTPYITDTNGSNITLAQALATGTTGSLDWSCASATSTIANSQNMPPLTLGTLLAKHAPANCR